MEFSVKMYDPENLEVNEIETASQVAFCDLESKYEVLSL